MMATPPTAPLSPLNQAGNVPGHPKPLTQAPFPVRGGLRGSQGSGEGPKMMVPISSEAIRPSLHHGQGLQLQAEPQGHTEWHCHCGSPGNPGWGWLSIQVMRNTVLMRQLGTLGGDTCSSVWHGEGRDWPAGMQERPGSCCYQLEQIYIPVQARPGDEISRQCPAGTQGEGPCTAHRTEPCPHSSSCATHSCAAFEGKPGKRNLPSSPTGRKPSTIKQPGQARETPTGEGTQRGCPLCLPACGVLVPPRQPKPSVSLPPPPQLHCPCSLFCARAKTQCYFCSRFLAAVEILLLHPRHGDRGEGGSLAQGSHSGGQGHPDLKQPCSPNPTDSPGVLSWIQAHAAPRDADTHQGRGPVSWHMAPAGTHLHEGLFSSGKRFCSATHLPRLTQASASTMVPRRELSQGQQLGHAQP